MLLRCISNLTLSLPLYMATWMGPSTLFRISERFIFSSKYESLKKQYLFTRGGLYRWRWTSLVYADAEQSEILSYKILPKLLIKSTWCNTFRRVVEFTLQSLLEISPILKYKVVSCHTISSVELDDCSMKKRTYKRLDLPLKIAKPCFQLSTPANYEFSICEV